MTKVAVMPKQVDHEQRRREITDAVWRIASTQGLEGVSLGQVAAAAGMSKGLVQHYFRSREEMLLHATRRLRERVEERVAAQLDAAASTPRAVLRALLVALLPTGVDGRTEALVANAFFLRALKDPAIAARFREGDALLREAMAAQLRAAWEAGHLTVGLQPAREADVLLAMVSGLSQAVLLGHLSADNALSAVDGQLDKLLSR
jgi:TetR/AcrR family transcriptional regulator, transcriptional repressor of bet genes